MTGVSWYKKGLVVGIIILFIGVGVQPVFANDISVSTTSDSEDCIDCQVLDGYSLLRVNLLFTRIKAVINFVSYRFGDIPEVKEKYEDIFNIINSNILLNPPILECSLLFMQFTLAINMFVFCLSIYDYVYPIYPNLALWIYDFAYSYWDVKRDQAYDKAKELECNWIWQGPP